jgi:putative membrane protein
MYAGHPRRGLTLAVDRTPAGYAIDHWIGAKELIMPDFVKQEFWELIPTVVYFVVGLLLFGFSIWVMDKVTPFSLRKEIEEDQNVALGVVVGAALIALGILLSAVIK